MVKFILLLRIKKQLIMATTQSTKAKTIRLNPSVIAKIEKLAEEENRNFSNMVETILLKVAKCPNLIRT